MGIGMKNALDLISDLIGKMDFGVNEQVCKNVHSLARDPLFALPVLANASL